MCSYSVFSANPWAAKYHAHWPLPLRLLPRRPGFSMSRPLAAAQPGAAVAAQPNVIAAAPVRYAQTNADVATPWRPYPVPIPFARPFPPPAPYPAAFYAMGPPPAFPPFIPPGTFPGPRVDLHPPPPPGVLGPYPGTPSLPTGKLIAAIRTVSTPWE
jgi:hypothetical protein